MTHDMDVCEEQLKDKKSYIFIYLSHSNPVRVTADSFIKRTLNLETHDAQIHEKKTMLTLTKSTCDEQMKQDNSPVSTVFLFTLTYLLTHH